MGFVLITVHGDADVVQGHGQDDHHLGILHGQAVIGNHAGDDTPLDKQAQ